MNDHISVPRELLERIGFLMDNYIGTMHPEEEELRALLSAPAAEVEGLEAVAWQDAENPLYTTGEKRQMHGWATDGYPIVPLCSMPKAQAIIDQLKDKLYYANQKIKVIDKRHGMLDQQAARIAELEREICYLMGQINGEKHE